jgi:hypothetical protein
MSGTLYVMIYYKPVYVQQPNKLLDNNDGQQWTLHYEYDKLHMGPKTMVTLVYQVKTNQRPSLLATHLIVQR